MDKSVRPIFFSPLLSRQGFFRNAEEKKKEKRDVLVLS